jgi:hypothetical protein
MHGEYPEVGARVLTTVLRRVAARAGVEAVGSEAIARHKIWQINVIGAGIVDQRQL